MGMENLDRNLALQRGIHALVHHAHSAGADLLEDPVPADVVSNERHTALVPFAVSRLGAAESMEPPTISSPRQYSQPSTVHHSRVRRKCTKRIVGGPYHWINEPTGS